MSETSEKQAPLQFVNGLLLLHTHHVLLVLREIHGFSVENSLTQWELNDFIRKTFPGEVSQVNINYR